MDVKDIRISLTNEIYPSTLENKKTALNRTILHKSKCFVKRLIDIIGSLFGIVLLVPITIFMILANTISGERGPVFYKQERIGKDGKTFELYKFRSMIVGADDKLSGYLDENEDAKREYTTYKKLKEDPRVTKMGAFIRKTSIDELPQFINVLKGDMSLVGPRPYLPREKKDMKEFYDSIIQIKPGLTGPWQVSGRSNTTFEERLEIESTYVEKNDLKSDVALIVKTVVKAFNREGAA